MVRWFLAAAVLLGGSVGAASADYIVLIGNVGQPKDVPPPPGPGQIGVPPGMGMIGVPSNEVGTPPPSSSSSAPMRSNQMGMPIGPMSGTVLGTPGAPAAGQPIQIMTVVEVSASFKALAVHARTVQINPNPLFPAPVPFETHDPWGEVKLLNNYDKNVSFVPLEHPTVAKTFEAKSLEAFKKDKDNPDKKPDPDKLLDLAKWALAHDLNMDWKDRKDHFAEVMKKLLEAYPDHPAAKAFQKLQADLDRPVTKDGAAADMQKQLGDNYKTATLAGGKGHYVLFYNLNANPDPDEIQERLARLEDALHTFYYWFASRGVSLPVPDERLPALLAAKEPEFDHTRDSLSDPPVVAEGFFARRENLSVYCARPLDEHYDMLDKTAAPLWSRGYNRVTILSGKEKTGYPLTETRAEVAYASMTALLLKALEDEAERTAVSHDASRQLLFASGLLPRNVAVPEWVQFGMGSFFETPMHSPWASPTGPSSLYLPVFRKEMSEGRKFEGDAFKTMRKIVTDGYFRELPPDVARSGFDPLRGNPFTEEMKKAGIRTADFGSDPAGKVSPDLLRARTATWSLMYYLANQKRDNLMRYFQLLGQMPRDLELDEDTLWETYARAFDAFDPKTKRVDEAKLGQVAAGWQSYVSNEALEAEALVKELQKTYSELNAPEPPKPPSP